MSTQTSASTMRVPSSSAVRLLLSSLFLQVTLVLALDPLPVEVQDTPTTIDVKDLDSNSEWHCFHGSRLSRRFPRFSDCGGAIRRTSTSSSISISPLSSQISQPNIANPNKQPAHSLSNCPVLTAEAPNRAALKPHNWSLPLQQPPRPIQIA